MSNPRPRVFWSWQSDAWPTACRDFIKDALADAVKAVGQELGLEGADRPELDHDTKGEAGMVDIAETILRKIAESAIFVADLTPIGETQDRKALPNPNVLVELGWALHKPGLERIIGVLNMARGWRIEDLPFDIRQKRILTYKLSEDADGPTRSAVHKQLVRSFVDALRTNLGLHLEEITAATDVTGVAARDGEPSIWASAKQTLTHHDAFGGAATTTVGLPSCPRGYIRAIPAGWRKGPPSVAEIARLRAPMAVWPRGGGGGDFGVNEEGFVRYLITDHDERGGNITTNVAAYFDETGEFWVLDGTAVGTASGRVMLRTESLLQGWSEVMRNSLAVFDHFEASAVRKVEVGLTGMSGVHWPSVWASDSPPARRNAFMYQRQSRDWTEEAQISFLTEAYNGVLNLFGLPKSDRDAVATIVRR